MDILLSTLVVTIAGGFGLRFWLVKRRRRRAAASRRIEAPNSHYSSQGVRDREDRERWAQIDLSRLHPLNRDEVERLLHLVDTSGVRVLSGKERRLLDRMTHPRLGG